VWIRTDNSADTLSVSANLNSYPPINDSYYQVYATTNKTSGCAYDNISGLIAIKTLPVKPILDDDTDTICQG